MAFTPCPRSTAGTDVRSQCDSLAPRDHVRMASFVPPQLHPLLGRALEATTETELARLVGASETEWLDAKRERYGNGDSPRRDLAADVAAFANRQGGLLVIGLDEGADGLISALTPISEADLVGEELRISQIISGNVAPVPSFTVHRVGAASGGGYLIVSVPPSVRRPHAVVVNDSLRYPVREGTGKRYLSESEVADLYRSRFADARSQVDRAVERHAGAVARLDRSKMAWLVMSLEPDWPGLFKVTRDNTDPLRTFGRTARVQFPTWFRSTTYTPVPSFRSLALYDGHNEVYNSTATLHLDGGGSVAFGWEWRPKNAMDEGNSKVAMIADEDIVGCLVNGIWALADWALGWCGASGDATLLVQLYAPDDYPMTLWQYRSDFPGRLAGARDLTGATGEVATTVSLPTIHNSATDLLLTTKRIAADLEMAFGVLGPPQIDPNGAVRQRYFYRDKGEWLRKWAVAWTVEVAEDAGTD